MQQGEGSDSHGWKHLNHETNLPRPDLLPDDGSLLYQIFK